MKRILFISSLIIACAVANAQTTAKTTEAVSESFKIEMATVAPITYLAVDNKADISTISKTLGESYGEIMTAMSKQDVKQAGPVFAIYRGDSETNFDFSACIPVNRKPAEDGNVKVGQLVPGKCVVAHFYGPYEKTAEGHKGVQNFIKSNDMKMTGLVWEEYVTDPGVEKDPTKWLTNIYYEVK
jgi:effector-binding domain-containing protein